MGKFRGRIYSDVKLSPAFIGELDQLANKAVFRRDTLGAEDFYSDRFILPNGGTLTVALGAHTEYAVYTEPSQPVFELPTEEEIPEEPEKLVASYIAYHTGNTYDPKVGNPEYNKGTTFDNGGAGGESQTFNITDDVPVSVGTWDGANLDFGVNNWAGAVVDGKATKALSWSATACRYGGIRESNYNIPVGNEVTYGAGTPWCARHTGWRDNIKDGINNPNPYPAYRDDSYRFALDHYVPELCYNGAKVVPSIVPQGAAIYTRIEEDGAAVDYFVWAEQWKPPEGYDTDHPKNNAEHFENDSFYIAPVLDPADRHLIDVAPVQAVAYNASSGVYGPLEFVRHQWLFNPTGDKAICALKYHTTATFNVGTSNIHFTDGEKNQFPYIFGLDVSCKIARVTLTIPAYPAAFSTASLVIDIQDVDTPGTWDKQNTVTVNESYTQYNQPYGNPPISLIDSRDRTHSTNNTWTGQDTVFAVDYDRTGAEVILSMGHESTLVQAGTSTMNAEHLYHDGNGNYVPQDETHARIQSDPEEYDYTTNSTGTITGKTILRLNGSEILSLETSHEAVFTDFRDEEKVITQTGPGSFSAKTEVETIQTRDTTYSGEYFMVHWMDLRANFIQYSRIVVGGTETYRKRLYGVPIDPDRYASELTDDATYAQNWHFHYIYEGVSEEVGTPDVKSYSNPAETTTNELSGFKRQGVPVDTTSAYGGAQSSSSTSSTTLEYSAYIPQSTIYDHNSLYTMEGPFFANLVWPADRNFINRTPMIASAIQGHLTYIHISYDAISHSEPVIKGLPPGTTWQQVTGYLYNTSIYVLQRQNEKATIGSPAFALLGAIEQ